MLYGSFEETPYEAKRHHDDCEGVCCMPRCKHCNDLLDDAERRDADWWTEALECVECIHELSELHRPMTPDEAQHQAWLETVYRFGLSHHIECGCAGCLSSRAWAMDLVVLRGAA